MMNYENSIGSTGAGPAKGWRLDVPNLCRRGTRARIYERAELLDDRDALDLDDDAGPGEARDGDEGARGVAPCLEELLADLDEAIAHAGVGDEHRHRHHVCERRAGALEGAAEEREHGACLLLELAGDVAALEVDERRHAGEPDDAPALGDHRRGIAAALLGFARWQVLELHEPRMTTRRLSTSFTP